RQGKSHSPRAPGGRLQSLPDPPNPVTPARGHAQRGEQQMLAIARALIPMPSLILMDEPSEGLSPVILGIVRDRIKAIQASGVGILLVEQNVKLALATCQRVYFMEKGLVRHEAATAELQQDKDLVSRYLGVKV